MSLTNTNQKGFTIVELLIVIVVIAILAAISIVAYTGVQDRARNSSAQQLSSTVAKKAEAYYAINGTYPTTAAEFNSTTNKEPNLEGSKVTLTTGVAPTTVATATFNSVAGKLDEFTSGSRVIYTGGSAGYVITYRTGASTTATISKGTAPTGTATFGSNEE